MSYPTVICIGIALCLISSLEQGQPSEDGEIAYFRAMFNEMMPGRISSENEMSYLSIFVKLWCGHSKFVLPGWKHLSAKIREKIMTGTIECNPDPMKPTIYRVNGQPTLYIYPDGVVEKEFHDEL